MNSFRQDQHKDTHRIVVSVADTSCRERLTTALQDAGHTVHTTRTALEFYALLAEYDFRLAVVDAELPDQDGLVVARFLNRNTSIASIMIVGNDEIEENRLAAYNAGALACFSKPVDLEEFSALVNNLVGQANARKVDNKQEVAIPRQAGGSKWKLLKSGWQLAGPKGTVKLTLKEFEFMWLLASSNQGTVSRMRLLDHMNYENSVHANKALEAVVHRLRAKTQTIGGMIIETAHRFGWGLSEQVELI